MREIPGLIAVDIGLGVAITGLGDQRGGVDDQRTEGLNAGPEAGQFTLRWPNVWRCVLGQIGEAVGWGVLQGCVLVEGAVDVVRALEGVEGA